MGARRLKLPEDVIRHWPEVFKNRSKIYTSWIPSAYWCYV